MLEAGQTVSTRPLPANQPSVAIATATKRISFRVLSGPRALKERPDKLEYGKRKRLSRSACEC